jgi:isocitrate dehydrogenase
LEKGSDFGVKHSVPTIKTLNIHTRSIKQLLLFQFLNNPIASLTIPSTATTMKNHSILILPGDGVGPEVMDQALRVLSIIESSTPSVSFTLTHDLCGGCSIDAHGVPITQAVIELAKKSDAVLFGAAGGPKWGIEGKHRPEDGLLTLRKELDCFANLRPCKFYSKSLIGRSVLKEESVRGVEFVIGMFPISARE